MDTFTKTAMGLTLPDVREESVGKYLYYNVDGWSFEDDWTEEEHWQGVLIHLAMIKYLRDKKESSSEPNELDRPEDSGSDPGGADTTERADGVECGSYGGLDC